MDGHAWGQFVKKTLFAYEMRQNVAIKCDILLSLAHKEKMAKITKFKTYKPKDLRCQQLYLTEEATIYRTG